MRQVIQALTLLTISALSVSAQAAPAQPEIQLCEQAKNPKNYVNDWVTQPLIALEGKYLFAYDPARPAYIEQYNPATLAELKRLVNALKSRGIQLIALVPPNRQMAYAVDRKNKVSNQDIKTYNAFLSDLTSAGITAPNLLNEIATGKTTFNQFFLKRDVHWSQQGSEYTAKLVADLIKKQASYAALPKTTFTLTRGAATPFPGAFAADLAKACGKPVPPETTRKIHLETSSDVGLLSDVPAAPVAIVGTSFTGSESLNFGDFFAYHSKLAVENYAVDGGLNYDSFLKYLASSSYQNHKPRIIIWESILDYPRNDPTVFRQLVAGVYGRCAQPLQQGKLTANAVSIKQATQGNKNYLYLNFGVSTVKNFTVNLQYQGSSEKVKITQMDRVDTKGVYFLELKSGSQALKQFTVQGVPEFASSATYALCQKS